MANRINTFLNRLGIFDLKQQILIPLQLIVPIIVIVVVYVRLVNGDTGFKHVGYARAQVLSAVATHSKYSLPGIHMRIALQNSATFQTIGSSAWINTLNGAIICVELEQREDSGQTIAQPTLAQKCEQLPQWSD